MSTNPMHQFEVYRVGPEINISGINLSFTNASFFMLISSLLILLMLFLGTKKKLLIPTKMQLMTDRCCIRTHYMIDLSNHFNSGA